MRPHALLPLALLALGCPRRDGTPPPRHASAPSGDGKVALPDGGMRHDQRLAWVAWAGDRPAFGACGRRTDDLASLGQRGRCWVVEGPGAAPVERDWTALPGFVQDRSPVDQAPGRCRVAVDDVGGDPAAPPARATLVGPGGAQEIAAWAVPATVDGDYFALETSFSPDGRWLAVVRAAVGLGGERLVEIAGVEVRPAPPCR